MLPAGNPEFNAVSRTEFPYMLRVPSCRDKKREKKAVAKLSPKTLVVESRRYNMHSSFPGGTKDVKLLLKYTLAT